ncbi:hypothetical protein EV673_2394 [Limnobacter thiooxidans]|uniref:DUF4148 domain-containing protein n=1 Tax=Limnobacter thiooxidans TaxID=131080 RepID=A0AA86J959_9BURK|nr:hypothetical protein [Limnobacter sp.]MCZ8014741.1 hypothetical protein [Limnobacter sp.]RZS40626.1 hypothetical protein EV673_2394 [Limnobacter thiooxidans]BET26940.1 hypothetical protein RGQ30_24410 [Limnobacter thiooxidans]
MNTSTRWISTLLICAAPVLGFAQDDSAPSPSTAGLTDAETGLSTRTWLKEQAEGMNRGETEPYRAESAGKAYRAYADAIGSKDQKAPVSQVSTIKTN